MMRVHATKQHGTDTVNPNWSAD